MFSNFYMFEYWFQALLDFKQKQKNGDLPIFYQCYLILSVNLCPFYVEVRFLYSLYTHSLLCRVFVCGYLNCRILVPEIANTFVEIVQDLLTWY